MSSDHPEPDPELEALVQRAALGEELSPRKRSRLDASPEASARLLELEQVLKDLDAAGETDRTELFEEAQELEDWPGRSAMRDRLEELFAEAAPTESTEFAEPGPTRWPRPALWGALTAAAALVLFFAWLRGPSWDPLADPQRDPGGSGTIPDGLMVGDARITDLQPSGLVDAWDTFRWEFELPEGGWFEVRVWSADAPEGAEPLLVAVVEEPLWIPVAVERAQLPPRMRWQVRAFSGNRLSAAAGADASLR